jgi:hypothetical protein
LVQSSVSAAPIFLTIICDADPAMPIDESIKSLSPALIEIPIRWYYQRDSRVRPFQDIINMVRELLRIRRNGDHGLYDGGSTHHATEFGAAPVETN